MKLEGGNLFCGQDPRTTINACALWCGLQACSVGLRRSNQTKNRTLDLDQLFEQPCHNLQVGNEALLFLLSLLRSPLAKNGRWMNRCHCKRCPGSLKDTPSFNAYLEVTSQKRLGSRCSQAHQDFGFNDLDLLLEPGEAGRNFSCARLVVDPLLPSWYPLEVLNNIGDVRLRPIDSSQCHGLIEHSACRTDKRLSIPILFVARLLSHQN